MVIENFFSLCGIIVRNRNIFICYYIIIYIKIHNTLSLNFYFMYQNKTISVIFPAYNEEENIVNAIVEFFNTKIVDEIVAVDNNSTDNTAKEIKKTKARYVLEKRQGYGYALQRGLKEANGDLIFMCEPDGTFIAKDMFKMLTYADDFDVVFGSRTSKTLIWDGAKMDWFLRVGNVIVAKLLEYLHNGPCLTDVGCTFKMIKRTALNKLIDKFTVGTSHFSPEFMLLCIKSHLKCVEIPVNYKSRIGDSKITGNTWNAFKLGLRMIGLTFKYKFKGNYG